jgi:hypothetical protein
MKRATDSRVARPVECVSTLARPGDEARAATQAARIAKAKNEMAGIDGLDDPSY